MKIAIFAREPLSGRFSHERVREAYERCLRESGHAVTVFRGDGFKAMLNALLRSWYFDRCIVVGDINFVVPFLYFKKPVLVIHDLGHYLHDLKGFKRFLFGLLWYEIPILSAHRLIFISKHTKTLCEEAFSVARRKQSCLIKNCAGYSIPLAPNRFDLSTVENIILVGRHPLKNINWLCQVLVGKGYRVTVIGDRKSNCLEDFDEELLVLDCIPDHEYVAACLSADIFVTASLDEGFGLVPIEMQSLGLPVIAMDSVINREILGSSVLYFQRNKADQLLARISELDDSAVYSSFVQRGFKNCERYSYPQFRIRLENFVREAW